MSLRILLSLVVLVGTLSPQTGLRFDVPLSSLTSNNTSIPAAAEGKAASTEAGNARAGNVSRVDVHQLFPDFKGLVFAHYMPWWGNPKHIDIGMDEHDPALLRAQVQDMIGRGFDGVLVTESNSGDFNTRTTEMLFAEVQKHPGFRFAISYTKWGLSTTEALVATLARDQPTYFSQPNYLKADGRPVVVFFDRPDGIDFGAVKQRSSPPPIFVFRNPGGFSATASDGAFAWFPEPDDPVGDMYLRKFYRARQESGQGKYAIGSVYKGFDDRLASWTKHRRIPQDCGRTLLNVARAIPESLNMMQVNTWNDYEEGSAVEPGIDNCGDLTIAVEGDQLALRPQFRDGGTEEGVHHYAVYLARPGTALALLKDDLPPGTRRVDLRAFPIPPGDYLIYVQMVGKPLFQNRLSSPVAWKLR